MILNAVGVLSFCLQLLVTPVVSGQEPHHPRISVVHPGFDALKADLKSVIDLADETEQEQWVNIQDYIDMFQIGIDGERPVRVDVLTGVTPTAYLVWVPLAKPENAKSGLADEFRDSLDAFGYATVRDPQERSLYRIEPTEGGEDTGWFHVMADQQYGIFVLTTNKGDMQLLRQLVLKAADPTKEVAELLAQNPAMAAELINTAQSEEDRARRMTAFAELRKISMDAIQKRPSEAATEFELRQALMRHQLNELERLMVEAAEIRAVASVDREGHKAGMKITAKAIDGTALHATIAEFNGQPDAFANIERLPKSALSVRVNHPLDEMRQTHANEMMDLMKKDLDIRIADDKTLTTDEKKSATELLEGLLGLTKDGVKTGYINAFVESVPLGAGEFTTVACISAPDATRLNELLPLLKSAGKNNAVEMNIGKAGDVAIHRIQLAEGFIAVVDRFFGKQQDLFVGVAPHHVWLASGPDAQKTMTDLVGSIGEPKQNGTVVHIELNALPWVQHLQEVAKSGSDENKTSEEKEAARSMERMRLRAIEAMSKTNDDSAVMDVTVADGVVSIDMSLDTGLLRFAGKMMAAFSKENFE